MHVNPLAVLSLLLVGCGTEAASTTPTWHADVAPIVVGKCGGCHSAGSIAPFALDDYGAAGPMADAALAAVEAGTMPPFDAYETDDCQPPQPWKNDPRLTEEEKATLRAWAEAGAPEGDPATAAPLPEPAGYALEGNVQTIEPGAAHTTSGDTDEFLCVSMDPELLTDGWLTGLDVLPGNSEVVHHAVVFSDPEGTSASWGDDYTSCFDVSGGQVLGVWVPGSPPLEYPEGSAITVAAGSRIVMQLHYHAGGRVADPDLTQVVLRWTDTAPEWTALVTAIGNASDETAGLLPGVNDRMAGAEFRIPANKADHVETMAIPIPEGTQEFSFFSIATHMHMVGTDMQIRWRRGVPEADEAPEDCLVRTGWDFDWQRTYAYDAPIEELPKGRGGDTLWMQCHYDNTLANPGVQRALADAGLDEPIDVTLGEGSLDEMCIGIVGLVLR
ncbi:MAG: hypothetical protein V4850_33220 [Myxococcota bacterium]